MANIRCPFCPTQGPHRVDCLACDNTGTLKASIAPGASGATVVVELPKRGVFDTSDTGPTVRVDAAFDEAITPRDRPPIRSTSRIVIRSDGSAHGTSVDLLTPDGRGVALRPNAIAFEADADGGRLSLSFPSRDVEFQFGADVHDDVTTLVTPLDDETRCAVCAWPLAESASDGCTRGSCSHRPPPARQYSPERAAREFENVRHGRPQGSES